MESDLTATALILSALVIGITHTLLGPDHYLPFVALGRARGWSRTRTLLVTLVCGIGHVAGSVLIGFLGLAAGWSLASLEAFESTRGEVAAWLLTAFGLVYLVWSLRRFAKGKRHEHVHVHADGMVHSHEHDHHGSHAHVHTADGTRRSVTLWSLFIIFVFGPCEALIPLLLFPALGHDIGLAFVVVGVFAAATIGTMLAAVGAMYAGVGRVRLGRFEGLGHVAAGLVILACGTAIHLGL